MARKFLQIPEFAKKGLNSDFMPWDLDGSYLTNISNIRILRGRLQPFGGSALLDELPTNQFHPGFLMYVNSTSGKFWIVAGDGVLAYDGDFGYITPSPGLPGVTDVSAWTGCMLANIPVLNNPGTYPMYWSPQSIATLCTYLPWDATRTWEEAGEGCRIMRSHKQFLIAMDLQTTLYGDTPDGVRWSSPADINGIPETWDHLDVTNVAGLTTLGGGGGRIVDGLSLRDSFVIYRESSITIMEYVANSPYVWRIRELMSTVGAVSANSIVEVKGTHYFIGDGDILFNDGNRVESLLHNRIRKRFVSNYDPENYRNSFAVKNSVAYEIWFCVPETGHEYPNIAYIYNWRDDTWSIRDIPETPMAAYGTQDSAKITWSNVPDTWETTPLLWTQSQLSPLDDTILCVTPVDEWRPGELRFLDKTVSAEAEAFDCMIERVGFALEGLNNTTTITSVYPHMTGPGYCYIRLGSQDHPGAPVRWKEPRLFSPGVMRKLDMRTTGELHCFQIYSNNTTETWAISGIDIEYADAGLR